MIRVSTDIIELSDLSAIGNQSQRGSVVVGHYRGQQSAVFQSLDLADRQHRSSSPKPVSRVGISFLEISIHKAIAKKIP
jgi:hypothetical protein